VVDDRGLVGFFTDARGGSSCDELPLPVVLFSHDGSAVVEHRPLEPCFENLIGLAFGVRAITFDEVLHHIFVGGVATGEDDAAQFHLVSDVQRANLLFADGRG
jgi:hypothetical protein